MHNIELRNYAKKRGVKLWQVAELYGLSDGNFSRLLRKELLADTYTKIISIIDKLSKEAK